MLQDDKNAAENKLQERQKEMITEMKLKTDILVSSNNELTAAQKDLVAEKNALVAELEKMNALAGTN